MIGKSAIEKSEAYYAAIGPVRWTLGRKDIYRMKRVVKHLYGKTILDVGCGKGDFLKLIKSSYKIAGIEVNLERVNYCNALLKQDVVKVGNLERKLEFENDSFDTVTSMEVIEHLVDPQKALNELVRISRKRIIITVPYNESIQYVLCVHCGKSTPSSNHLHTFNKENIKSIIPTGVTINRLELIGNSSFSYLPFLSKFIYKLPYTIISIIDRILNFIIPRANWMIVILEKD